MRSRLRRLVVAGALWAALTPSPRAFAYDAMVQASVATQAYQLRAADNVLVTLRRLDTYLRLFVLDLWPRKSNAREAGPQMHFVLSLRIRADFGGFSREWDPGRWGHGAQRGFNPAFDLMYAYLQVTDLAGRVDLTLGRQLRLDPLDIYGLDGVRARIRLPAHLAVETLWGARISGALAFDAPIFLKPGIDPTESRQGVLPMLGAALTTHGLRFLSARLAYRATWRVLSETDRAAATIYPDQTAAALPKSQPIEEKVVAWAQLSLLRRRLLLYGGVRYNGLLAQIDESQAGVSAVLGRGAKLSAEHVIRNPDFDGDSIFNIFNLYPFQEVRVTYDQRLLPRLHGYLRGSVRLVSGGDPEAPLSTERRAIEVDAGGGLGVRYLGRRFAARGDLFWQEGYGGRTFGAFGAWRHVIIPGWLSWEGRASVTSWNDKLSALPKGVTAGIGVGARARFGRRVAVHLLFEDNFGTYNKSDLRLFAMMSVSWCTWNGCPAGKVAP